MHPRLVEDDMRELGEPLLSIQDPTSADDALALSIVRPPERHLINPIGLLQHALAEAKGVEHLHRPTGNTVGLAAEQSAGLLFDDAGLDVGKSRELRRQGQASRPASDDQNINLIRKVSRSP